MFKQESQKVSYSYSYSQDIKESSFFTAPEISVKLPKISLKLPNISLVDNFNFAPCF